MFWLLSGIYFYTEQYSLTALLVSRKMFSPYSMWHCNATRQKQGKRERMSMCASVCVGFFFFIFNKCLLRFTYWDEATKDAKKEAADRRINGLLREFSAQSSFKVHPFSFTVFFLFPVLYKWVTVQLSSLNQPPSFQWSVQCSTLRVLVVFYRFKFDWTIKSRWYSVVVYNCMYYYKSVSHQYINNTSP